jgi:hemoglobin
MTTRIFYLTILSIVLSACASLQGNSDQLYRDLGQQPGIERLVDGLLDNIARDERIFAKFRDSNIDRLRSKLIEQFCSLSGGPCKYNGESMEKSHGGMSVTEAEFNALVEDLIDAMEAQQVPVSAQNRLLALLAPMRPQVIHQ